MGIILFFIFILAASAFMPQYVLVFVVLNLLVGLFLFFFQVVVDLHHFEPK